MTRDQTQTTESSLVIEQGCDVRPDMMSDTKTSTTRLEQNKAMDA